MSDSPVFCTVAQVARRVGLSDGRVRAMWAGEGGLPEPDGFDDDGHPLWLPDTVDRWGKLRRQSRRELIDELLDRSSLGGERHAALAARTSDETLQKILAKKRRIEAETGDA
jgi:hypothetical protein